MLSIVKTISTRLDDAGRRLQKFLRLGKDDVQEKQIAAPYGIDSNCPKDFVAIYAETTSKGKEVVLGYINKNLVAEVGETRIFSTNSDGSSVQFYIHMKTDGTAEFLGTGDFLTRFNETEAAYNQLKDDHDALVDLVNDIRQDQQIFATAYVPGGPAAVGLPATYVITTSPGSHSTGDISAAKIDEMEVPSA